MATAIFAGRTMPGWIKAPALAAAAFFVCWAGAITYWRAFDRMPSTVELLLSLLALPLILMLALWFGHGLITGRTAVPASPSAAAQAASAPAHAAALAIHAASLRSPHGASPAELAQAIAANKARADLDPELVDDDGFPVMTARCGDAFDEALQEEIGGWLAENGMADLAFNDEQWRALTLATGVAVDLAREASNCLISEEATPPLLQLMPVLPADWSIGQHHAAGVWLKHVVSRFGWPLDRIALPAEMAAAPENAAPTAAFGRLAQDAAGHDAPLAAIVVVAASHIGDESISQWAASGTLFTSSNQKGAIPGEGAAGVLVTDMRLAHSRASIAVLEPMEEALRESSADEARRVDSKLLGQLTDSALGRAGTEPSTVGMVVADTGHRPSRTLELMGHVSAKMPHLDSAGDVALVGMASGTCGAVPFMTSLALAHHFLLESQAPVLFVSNEDPFRRTVALVRAPAETSETI